MRHFYLTWLSVLCCVMPCAAAERPTRPNFVIINIDDLGYADIGPFGSTINRTPHLDRMAKEGCRLTSFYAAPVCSPSRSALMTGCYPKRVLPISHVLFPAGEVGLNQNEETIADLLKPLGYATACVGKWHLGDQPSMLPTDQGFDYYLGIPYSNDMGTAAEGSKSDLGKPLPMPKETAGIQRDELGLRGNSQPPLPLVEQTKVVGRVKQDEQQAIVETYTKAAVKFIEEQRDLPFLLYLPHSAVHFPIYPGKAWAGKSPHGHYSDWVEEVDDSVGQILETLRRLKLDDQTLVIFTSDNGGTQRGSNQPLRGFKASTWEGGIRTCTLAWWPGQIPAGSATDVICGMFDLLPTCVELAGGKVPTDRVIDGRNLWPVLSGQADAKPPHDVFYYFRGLQLEAVRSGPWKLHLAVTPPNAKKAGAKSEPQLYHLERDIAESQNVIAEHPEVVTKIQQLIKSMDQDLGTNGVGPGCRTLGRVPNPQPFLLNDGSVRADAVGTTSRFP